MAGDSLPSLSLSGNAANKSQQESQHMGPITKRQLKQCGVHDHAGCIDYVAWLSALFSSKPDRARVSSKLDRTSCSHARTTKPNSQSTALKSCYNVGSCQQRLSSNLQQNAEVRSKLEKASLSCAVQSPL